MDSAAGGGDALRSANAISESRPEKTLRSDSRFPFQSSSRRTTRRSVRATRRGSQTRRGRSSQTTVSARSSTRSPSLPR